MFWLLTQHIFTVQITNKCPFCKLRFGSIHCMDSETIISEEDEDQKVESDDLLYDAIAVNAYWDSIPCNVCKKADPEDDDVAMLCDGCDGVWHTFCVGLDAVPTEDWFCDECVGKKQEAEVSPVSRAWPRSKGFLQPNEHVLTRMDSKHSTSEWKEGAVHFGPERTHFHFEIFFFSYLCCLTETAWFSLCIASSTDICWAWTRDKETASPINQERDKCQPLPRATQPQKDGVVPRSDSRWNSMPSSHPRPPAESRPSLRCRWYLLRTASDLDAPTENCLDEILMKHWFGCTNWELLGLDEPTENCFKSSLNHPVKPVWICIQLHSCLSDHVII